MATGSSNMFSSPERVTSIPETPLQQQQQQQQLDQLPVAVSTSAAATTTAAVPVTRSIPSVSSSCSTSCLPSMPVFSLPSTITKLGQQELMICERVTNTLSSWVGDYMNSMQECFDRRFNEAMLAMKAEMTDYIDSRSCSCTNKSPYDDTTTEMEDTQRTHGEMIEEIEKDTVHLKERCTLLEGRLARNEKEVSEVKEELLIEQARSMGDNLKFFNIPEGRGEDCEQSLRQFLINEMLIDEPNMNKIHFDKVHRIGEPSRLRHRVMIAKFNPSEGKTIVKQHIKNLNPNKGFGVNDHLPREMEERKKQLLPAFKKAKAEKEKPRFVMDKLVVQGAVTEVKKDQIRDINADTTGHAIALQDQLTHTPKIDHNGDVVQGHSMKVSNQEDIIPTLHTIYSDSRVARATHNIYAYRLKCGNRYVEHFEDDREWGAGRMLLDLLRNENRDNELVCVTRWYGGKRIGKKRFDYMLGAAKEALMIH